MLIYFSELFLQPLQLQVTTNTSELVRKQGRPATHMADSMSIPVLAQSRIHIYVAQASGAAE